MFDLGNFWDKSFSWFLKISKLSSFYTSSFSKMHSKNLFQIAPSNMWLLVLIKLLPTHPFLLYNIKMLYFDGFLISRIKIGVCFQWNVWGCSRKIFGWKRYSTRNCQHPSVFDLENNLKNTNFWGFFMSKGTIFHVTCALNSKRKWSWTSYGFSKFLRETQISLIVFPHFCFTIIASKKLIFKGGCTCKRNVGDYVY